jgi:hypothetical protein
MNFFAFSPNFITQSENYFGEFLDRELHNPKGEFFIPLVVDKVVKNKEGNVKVIPTSAQWFGVTYKEDAPEVKASVDKLVADGQYPSNLWA